MEQAAALSDDLNAAIVRALDTQLKNDTFDAWFNELDISTLLPPGLYFPAHLLPRAKDGIRSMCWIGWRARDSEIFIFNLRAAALRDTAKENDALRAAVKRLTDENAELRAQMRRRRPITGSGKDAAVRRLVARRA